MAESVDERKPVLNNNKYNERNFRGQKKKKITNTMKLEGGLGIGTILLISTYQIYLFKKKSLFTFKID